MYGIPSRIIEAHYTIYPQQLMGEKKICKHVFKGMHSVDVDQVALLACTDQVWQRRPTGLSNMRVSIGQTGLLNIMHRDHQ
jgi:hypothetical protein